MNNGLTAREGESTLRDMMTPEQMRALRHRLGWTCQEMAEYLGLKRREQISRMERGLQRIRGPEALLLAQLQARTNRQEKLGKSTPHVDKRGGLRPSRVKKKKPKA